VKAADADLNELTVGRRRHAAAVASPARELTVTLDAARVIVASTQSDPPVAAGVPVSILGHAVTAVTRHLAGDLLARRATDDAALLTVDAGLRHRVAVVTGLALVAVGDPIAAEAHDLARDLLTRRVAYDAALLTVVAGLRDDVAVVAALGSHNQFITSAAGRD